MVVVTASAGLFRPPVVCQGVITGLVWCPTKILPTVHAIKLYIQGGRSICCGERDPHHGVRDNEEEIRREKTARHAR